MIREHFTRFIKSLLFIVLVLMLVDLDADLIYAASTRETVPVIYPTKVPVKPRIDGELDDDAWKTEPLKEDFVSFSPGYGEISSQQTLVWLAYDDKNLYFAFLCVDSEPQQIKTSIAKRDNMFEDDWVAISLDTHGNRQTTYYFCCNPNGIQGDLLDSAISGQDGSPDFVWESAGKLTEQGYQVEMCIPMSSISFKSGKEVKMGILFKRKITHLGVKVSWPEIKPEEGRFNAHAVVVYKNLKKPLKLELLPAVTYGRNQNRMSMQEWDKDTFTDFGIGLKYGITSSITGEITINPDFSQVESDAFQVEVNQRYPIFYTEKRPFFMEGVGIFSFFTIDGGYFVTPVHTRRIVDPQWGAKITGTVGKASFGLLSAADEWPGPGKRYFGIVRGKYSLSKDNYIGLLYSGCESTGEYNRVFGADIGYRLFKDHKINASFLHSISEKNDGQADNTNSSNFNFLYSYLSKHLEMNAGVEHIGRDFRMDSSFLMRNGINDTWFWAEYNFYPNQKKLPWLKQISPGILIENLHDLTTNMNDPYVQIGTIFSFIKQGALMIDYSYRKESWQGQAFELGQFNLTGTIQLTPWLKIEGQFSSAGKIHYEANPAYKGKGYDGIFSLVLQPNKNLNQQFKFVHSDFYKSKEKIYDVNIFYSRTTYQFNKYLFVRGVVQYNSYQKRMLTDFLASFTLIPGTVFHIGYGSLYENRKWQDGSWLYRQGEFLNVKNSFFVKASYLWRF